MDFLGFGIGLLFGAALFLAGLANPDKMVGALRMKDLHAMRVIGTFVVVGLVGTTVLDVAFGAANFSIKPAAIASILVGGSLLGAGMGLTGYCPGTGLACAAAGRLDALVAVGGMLVGAAVFIFVYPLVAVPLDSVANLGKQTLPELTGLSRSVLTLAVAVPVSALLWFTRPGRPNAGDRSRRLTPAPNAG